MTDSPDIQHRGNGADREINDTRFVQRRRLLSAGLLVASGLPGASANAQATAPKPGRGRPLAVVLGGGSARGFAHIGVVKAFDAAGIRPDLIVGCSAGSLIGAFWAAGFSGVDMERIAMEVQDREIIDLVSGGDAQQGMVTGQSLQNFVNQALAGRHIETLRTRFIAVATEYPSGDLVTFDRGDTGFAVRASCSIPGIFVPARRGASRYLDGGLVSPLPVETARRNGAELVIAVDIGGPDPHRDDEEGFGIYKLLLRSFEIISDALRKHEAAGAHILVRPSVENVASTNFAAREALIAIGMQAGTRLVPVIREMAAK